MREFRYLRDPLFLAAVAVFFVNRSVLERIWSSGFAHNHVNDLICVPVLIPIMLTLLRWLGVRRQDGPPQTREIVIPLLVWGLFFEVLLPLHPFWGQWASADPYDVVCYWIGGVVAAMCWRAGFNPRDARCQRAQIAAAEHVGDADAGSVHTGDVTPLRTETPLRRLSSSAGR